MIKDLYITRGPVAAFVAEGVFWGSFAGLVPALKSQVGMNDAEFGLAMLISAVGAFFAMWLAPWIERQLGRWTLPALSLFMAGAFLAPGLAMTWVGFAIAMMFAAMGSGTLDVAMNARVSVLEAQSGRSLMNLNHGMFSVAYACAALGAGFGREIGLAPFHVFAIMVAVTLLLAVQMLAAPVHDSPAEEGAVPVKRLPWALILPAGAIVLIGFMTEQSTEAWSALHLERNLGAGAAMGALGPAILGITMAVGRLSGQMAVQRFSEAVVLRGAASLAALGTVLAAFAPSLTVAYVGFAMLGLGVSVTAPMAFAWVGRMVPDAQKPSVISRLAMVGYAGFFIGPPIMGFLAQGFGLHASFGAIAIVLLAIPLVFVPIVARRSR